MFAYNCYYFVYYCNTLVHCNSTINSLNALYFLVSSCFVNVTCIAQIDNHYHLHMPASTRPVVCFIVTIYPLITYLFAMFYMLCFPSLVFPASRLSEYLHRFGCTPAVYVLMRYTTRTIVNSGSCCLCSLSCCPMFKSGT